MNNFKYKNALIVGRFYPFHLGHKNMIRFALQDSERVHVIVCVRDEQTVTGEMRMEWIQKSFDYEPRLNIILLFQDELGIPDDGSQIWANLAQDMVGASTDIDAVVTSEPYQKEYAGLLGAELVLYNPERTFHPISATRLRADLEAHKDFLDPHVFQDLQGIESMPSDV